MEFVWSAIFATYETRPGRRFGCCRVVCQEAVSSASCCFRHLEPRNRLLVHF